jgi:hypothetical protein
MEAQTQGGHQDELQAWNTGVLAQKDPAPSASGWVLNPASAKRDRLPP